MKHCFMSSVLYIGVAFYGTIHTCENKDNVIFKEDLHKYIKELRSDANAALTIKWLPFGGSVINFFSKKCEKGNSVDRNELLLLTGYTDEEYKEAIELQDIGEIEKLSQDAYNTIKHEKDVNKAHDQLYDLISKYNANKLFGDRDMSRHDAIKKMLDSKNDIHVKKQFVFGVAVTKSVEEMIKKKK